MEPTFSPLNSVFLELLETCFLSSCINPASHPPPLSLVLFVCLFFLLAALYSLWDFSSPTRGQIQALSSESRGQTTGWPRKFSPYPFLKEWFCKVGSSPASIKCNEEQGPFFSYPCWTHSKIIFKQLLENCLCKRHRRREFDLWVRKIPWSRIWQPTLILLPKKSHGQRSLKGSQRVRHNWLTKHTWTFINY